MNKPSKSLEATADDQCSSLWDLIRRAADLLKRVTQDSENRQRSQGLLREGQNLFQRRRYRECITKLHQVLSHSPLDDQALTLLQRALEAQALTTRAARIRARTPLNEYGELLST